MNYVLAIFLFVFSSFFFNPYGNAEEISPKIPFEDIVKFESNGQLVATGNFKRGTPFLLLSEDSTTCLAEAAHSEMLEDAPDPFEITNLIIKDKCKSQNFIGALVGITRANYQYIKLEPFKSPDLIDEVYAEAKKYESPKCPDYLQLKKSFNYLWLIPHHKEKIIVAQIKREANPNGPLSILKNNHIYLLEGGCTKEIKTFSINNRLYIRYDELGCDGGILVNKVYDLSGIEPILIYSNSMWST
jgi:hypothetical protein